MAESFNDAAAEIENFFKAKGATSDDNKLAIYGLFKQATAGDNNTAKPGMLDFKGKAKWESWNTKKGLSSDEAKAQYVALSKKIISEGKK